MRLEDRDLPADMIVLSIKELDIILGYNWLTKYRVNLDRACKTISLTILGQPSFDFQCNLVPYAFLTSRLATIESSNTEIYSSWTTS